MNVQIKHLLLLSLFAAFFSADADLSKSVFYVDGLAVDALDDPKDDEMVLKPFSLEMPVRQPKQITEDPGAPSTGIALPDPAAADHLRNAELYLEDEEWELARAEFEKALESGGSATRIASRAALRFSQLGQIALAEPFYRQFAARVPDDAAMIAGWTAALIRLNRITEAERVLSGVLDQAGGNLLVRFHQAMLDVLNDRPISNAEFWSGLVMRQTDMVANWLYVDKDSVEAVMGEAGYRAFSDILLGVGTYDHLEAIVESLAALMGHLHKREWKQALFTMTALEKMGVNNKGARFDRMRLLLQLGRNFEGLKLARMLTADFPDDSSSWYNYGSMLLGANLYREAETAFQRGLDLVPNWSAARFGLVCARIANGRKDESWAMLEEMADEDPAVIRQWIGGREPYLRVIRNDPRFPALAEKLNDASSE